MIQKFLSIVAIILLTIIPNCFAEDIPNSRLMSFETITNSDGLSHNNVRCIFQDSKGFLWIGTNSGLNRYDGKNYLIFKHDPQNPQTISSNCILGISEDIYHNIWVATDYGLNLIMRDTYKCNRSAIDSTSLVQFSKIPIQSVFCDSEGNIWIKTNQNITRGNLKTHKLRSYTIETDIFKEEFEQYSYPIFQDSQGILWIGSENGLGYYEPENDDFIFFKEDEFLSHKLSNNHVLSIFEDSKQRIWIGTRNGLNLFDKNKKTFTTYYYSTKIKTIVNGIAEGYHSNFLWITTESNGVFAFNTDTKQFYQFSHAPQQKGISTNQTNCIIKANGNILWIGSQNGLNKLDVKPKRFQLIGNEEGEFGRKYNYTTAIYIERNLVFFGTKFGGVQIYDLDKKTKQTFAADMGNFPTNHITSIIKLSDNEILIGSNGYLTIYNTTNRQFYSIDKKYPSLHSFCITKKRISALLLDSQERLWIGTNYGIISYDIAQDKIIHFDKNLLPSNKITCFYENYKNKLFIGTENGVVFYDHKTDSFHEIKISDTKLAGLNKHIYDITEDNFGNIWIGSNLGLIKCNPGTLECTFFTTKDGLATNEIYSVLTNDTELWLGTDNGLASFLPEEERYKKFSIHDGLQDYDFSPHSAFRASNGYMFFGGPQGINIFHPDSIKASSIKPNFEFLQLEYTIDNKIFTNQLKDNQKISIPWNNSDITISFALLEFTQPLMNQYKYYISDLTNTWIDLENQNYINIIKLPVGKYTLKVKASNSDGIWSNEKSIIITVPAPFWRTKTAFIIYIGIILLIIFLVSKLISKKFEEKNKRILDRQKWTEQLELQQEELEVKNKNILDSITYAKRIQSAIMPARAKFKQLIPSYFILYMPKDIVSGDFYWITKIDTKIFIVCSDCTGHGVPGAFMSIIGDNLLRNITTSRNIHKASEILDYLNKSLIELFTKNELDDETPVKDGMDISICVFHTDTGVLEYSGALTRMLLVRNNQFITYRGDKNPVGLSNEQDNLFTTAIIRVQKGDRFYMFSDGYADQFGGESGKKMKFKHFKHNILSVQHLPMMKQGIELKKQFQQWQGDWEQVDDVIVMGFEFNNYIEALEKNKSL